VELTNPKRPVVKNKGKKITPEARNDYPVGFHHKQRRQCMKMDKRHTTFQKKTGLAESILFTE